MALYLAGRSTALAQESTPTDETDFAYVGSRTAKERNARGKGIEIYEIGEDARWTHSATAGDLINPSFTNAAETLLFTVHGDLEQVSSFRIDGETGQIEKLSTASTQGKNPVHLALDAGEEFLIVANHLSGTVVALPVTDDGTLGEVAGKIDLPGEPGPHRVEQPFSKPHYVDFDPEGEHIIVPTRAWTRFSSFPSRTGSSRSSRKRRHGRGPARAIPFSVAPARLSMSSTSWTRR